MTRPNATTVLTAILIMVASLVSIGCHSEPSVVQYEIPTAVPAALQSEPDRMLAAMVPVGSDVWFYKVTDQQSLIDNFASMFESFVQGVAYDADGPLLENLPDRWRRGGPRSFRFATIDVPTTDASKAVDERQDGKQLDISISKLSKQGDYEAMISMNVNRWRNQLGLAPSDEVNAGAATIDIAAADDKSIWVDLTGQADASSPMMAGGFRDGDQMKFAGGPKLDRQPSVDGSASVSRSPSASPPTSPSSAKKDASTDRPSPVTFKTPDGWRPGRTSSMRLASFDVGPKDEAAEITVIPAGGDLRSNVARWIGQIRGETPPESIVDEAMAAAEEVTVDERSGQRFYLTGSRDDGDATADSDDPSKKTPTVIDATVIDLGDGFSLFVKMTGPSGTVSDQRKRIADFLDSMKINL